MFNFIHITTIFLMDGTGHKPVIYIIDYEPTITTIILQQLYVYVYVYLCSSAPLHPFCTALRRVCD